MRAKWYVGKLKIHRFGQVMDGTLTAGAGVAVEKNGDDLHGSEILILQQVQRAANCSLRATFYGFCIRHSARARGSIAFNATK